MVMADHLFFLLLPLYAIAASAEVFVRLDCGSNSDVYTDKNGITWRGDNSYIHTGENKLVQTPNSVSEPMNTLRVFSNTRKKNCYSIDFTKGKKVLVRASFYYGNYDKKSSPPSFDLQFDGNHWTNVDTSIRNDVIYEEAIYVSRKDAISVCLAQTEPNQLPFISALEVMSLDSGMYGHVDSRYALFLAHRIALGANKIIRYPDDKYDRIWIAVPPGADGYIIVANNASEISNSDSLDSPPSIVLQNALTKVNRAWKIVLDTNLPKREVPVYIKWYFTEVTELDSTQQRWFTILIDGAPVGCPIVPLYGSVREEYIVDLNASSKTEFALVSTYNSTLPPLINAMEVFTVSDPLTDGTYGVDVEQLSLLQTQFAELAGWSGDPCLPTLYKWDWVACSSHERPRITALYLRGFGLSGTLPNFSSMVALQTIDLSNNSLRGEFPRFLDNLPNLQELNLANNDFNGSVPTSMSRNKKLKLEVSGNQKLCIFGNKSTNGSMSSSSKTSSENSKNLEVSSDQKSLIFGGKSFDPSMTSSLGHSSDSSTKLDGQTRPSEDPSNVQNPNKSALHPLWIGDQIRQRKDYSGEYQTRSRGGWPCGSPNKSNSKKPKTGEIQEGPKRGEIRENPKRDQTREGPKDIRSEKPEKRSGPRSPKRVQIHESPKTAGSEKAQKRSDPRSAERGQVREGLNEVRSDEAHKKSYDDQPYSDLICMPAKQCSDIRKMTGIHGCMLRRANGPCVCNVIPVYQGCGFYYNLCELGLMSNGDTTSGIKINALCPLCHVQIISTAHPLPFPWDRDCNLEIFWPLELRFPHVQSCKFKMTSKVPVYPIW